MHVCVCVCVCGGGDSVKKSPQIASFQFVNVKSSHLQHLATEQENINPTIP